MFELINKENGNYLVIKNGKLTEMDLKNYRYSLDGNGDSLSFEYDLLSVIRIIMENTNIKVKIIFPEPKWVLRRFVQGWSTKWHLFFIKNIFGVEKFFIWHSKKPYKYLGQDKLVRDFQIFTAYNCGKGKTKMRISKKTFDKMIPENNKHLYKKENLMTKKLIFFLLLSSLEKNLMY